MELNQILDKITIQPNNQLQTQPEKQSLPSTEVSYSPEDKASITAQLGACLAVQRTYGKQASDIVTVSKIFFEDLKEFSGKQVAEAIAKWRKTSPEFPTPADIFAILNPTPKLDRATYIAFNKRKAGLSDHSQEMRYIRAYERQELKKVETPWDRLTWQEKNDLALKAAGITREPVNKPATPLQKEITPEKKAELLAEWNARNKQKPVFDVSSIDTVEEISHPQEKDAKTEKTPCTIS